MADKKKNDKDVEARKGRAITSFLSKLRKKGLKSSSWAAVRTYLTKHSRLRSAVQTACTVTAEEFGPQTELSLDLYVDRETKDKYLTLYVRLGEYDEAVIGRINQVAEKMHPHLQGRAGHLLITTDFRALSA